MCTEGRLRMAAAPPAVPRKLAAWAPPALLLRAPRAMLACGGGSTPRPRPSQLVLGRTPPAQTSSLTLRAGNVLAGKAWGYVGACRFCVVVMCLCGSKFGSIVEVGERAIRNLL